MQDIRGTLVNITKSVTKTSGDLIKTTKLSMNLSSEETNLKNLYMEIGKKVHEIYQYGGSLGKFFDEKYLEIEASERKIADIKEQISVIKGTRACVKCGKTVDRSAEFCQKCGIRVELSHGSISTTAQENVDQQPLMENEANIEATPVPNTTPLPLTQEPAPAAETPLPPEPILRSCRVCNSKNEAGTKFCLSCGRILD